MHELFGQIAEAKIRQAIENGQLKNLPGEGKPLELDSMAFIPADQRMAFKIMKNAGLVPEEVTLQKEMDLLRQSIAKCSDKTEKEALKKKLRERETVLGIMIEKKLRRKK